MRLKRVSISGVLPCSFMGGVFANKNFSLGPWFPLPPVQQHRIPFPLLGSTLFPILADGPSAFLAPLPSGALGVSSGDGCIDRVHFQPAAYLQQGAGGDSG